MIRPRNGILLVKPIAVVQKTNLIINPSGYYSEGIVEDTGPTSDFRKGERVIYTTGDAIEDYEFVKEDNVIAIRYE